MYLLVWAYLKFLTIPTSHVNSKNNYFPHYFLHVVVCHFCTFLLAYCPFLVLGAKIIVLTRSDSSTALTGMEFCFPFSRFWLVGQRRPDGLYDIVFAHIARKEEFDLFLSLKKSLRVRLMRQPQLLL